MLRRVRSWVSVCAAAGLMLALFCGNASGAASAAAFPPPPGSYNDGHLPLGERLRHRITAEPLNLAATIIFGLAILNIFLAPKIMHLAHRWRDQHRAVLRAQEQTGRQYKDGVEQVSFKAEVAHFLGEVEAVFGIWVVPLIVA